MFKQNERKELRNLGKMSPVLAPDDCRDGANCHAVLLGQGRLVSNLGSVSLADIQYLAVRQLCLIALFAGI